MVQWAAGGFQCAFGGRGGTATLPGIPDFAATARLARVHLALRARANTGGHVATMPTMRDSRITTADQLLALDEPGFRYELVRGELRRMSNAGWWHGAIAAAVGEYLSDSFGSSNRSAAPSASTARTTRCRC